MKIRVSWFDEYRQPQSCIFTVRSFIVSRYGMTFDFGFGFAVHAYWDDLENGFDILDCI